MTLVELPRRRSAPRVFVEPTPDLGRRVSRALDALGDLPDELDLPGRGALAEALIALADALDDDPDLEGDDDGEAEDDADEAPLPLFAFAGTETKKSRRATFEPATSPIIEPAAAPAGGTGASACDPSERKNS